MGTERKLMTAMRLPRDLVERVDFVARNHDSDVLVDRTAVITAAIKSWLPGAEARLLELGLTPPKEK